MTEFSKAFRQLALAAGLAAPLMLAADARADSSLACAALASGSADAHTPATLQIEKVQQLYQFQQRPYLRVPEGVALWVRAPRGMTAADLHNLLGDCQRQLRDDGSALCVKGAALTVERSGGHYVVRVTSTDRATAAEIQRRAARK